MLKDLFEKFVADVEAEMKAIESSLADKVQAGKQAVHDAWDAMGADLKALEEKVVTHPITAAKDAAEARVKELEAQLAAVFSSQAAPQPAPPAATSDAADAPK